MRVLSGLAVLGILPAVLLTAATLGFTHGLAGLAVLFALYAAFGWLSGRVISARNSPPNGFIPSVFVSANGGPNDQSPEARARLGAPVDGSTPASLSWHSATASVRVSAPLLRSIAVDLTGVLCGLAFVLGTVALLALLVGRGLH